MLVSACSNGFEAAVIGKYGGEVNKSTMGFVGRVKAPDEKYSVKDLCMIQLQ